MPNAYAIPRPVASLRSRSPRAIALLSLVVAVMLAGCGKKEQQGGPGGPGGPGGAMPVTVLEARVEKVPVTVEVVGQSEGSKEVQVRARVSGILLKKLFNEGDRVKAGSVLYQIDPAEYEIALAQAQASLAQARATAEQATREEARLKPLAAEQAISGKDYDDATSTRKTSDAQVMAREADVRSAQLNLSYTRVIAPIGGITGRSQNSEGTLVVANADSALLTTISQTDPIWVRFSFGDSEYGLVRSHESDAKVKIISPDGRRELDGGKLNFAASTVDRTLGTVQLRAEVPNPALAVLPGQFVKVRVLVGTEDAYLIPQAAILNSDQGKAVMVVDNDGKVAPRPVEVGGWQGSNWVVRKGLSPGDKVIIDNIVKLRPGMPVAPHPPQSAPGGQGAPGQAQPGPAPAGSKS